MRKIFILLICFIGISLESINAQTKWERELNYFKELDARNGVTKGEILFIGSSTFTLWKDVNDYFPGYKIVNRAFGGSKMREVLQHFDMLVKTYEPKQVVVYEGDNDLSWAEYSVDEYMKDMRCFVRLVQINFPKTKISIVSIKPSPSKSEKTLEKFRDANSRLKEFCFQNNIDYINTYDAMLNKDGSIKKEIFKSDMLHMNPDGYKIWKEVLSPYLIK